MNEAKISLVEASWNKQAHNVVDDLFQFRFLLCSTNELRLADYILGSTRYSHFKRSRNALFYSFFIRISCVSSRLSRHGVFIRLIVIYQSRRCWLNSLVRLLPHSCVYANLEHQQKKNLFLFLRSFFFIFACQKVLKKVESAGPANLILTFFFILK